MTIQVMSMTMFSLIHSLFLIFLKEIFLNIYIYRYIKQDVNCWILILFLFFCHFLWFFTYYTVQMVSLSVCNTSNNKIWCQPSDSWCSKHYLALIMCPGFRPTPIRLRKKKISVHHYSLHPGTTQSAKRRSRWDSTFQCQCHLHDYHHYAMENLSSKPCCIPLSSVA